MSPPRADPPPPIPADPGHIGDAAEIEHRERLWQRRGESGVEQRRQRRALAAGGDIGRAKIGDDVDPEPARQPSAVAQLPGAPLGRAMQDRVAVQADDVGCHTRMAREKLLDRFGMQSGELGFDLADRANAAEYRPQPFAKYSPDRGSSAPGRRSRARGRRFRSSRHRCRRARCRSSARSRAAPPPFPPPHAGEGQGGGGRVVVRGACLC